MIPHTGLEFGAVYAIGVCILMPLTAIYAGIHKAIYGFIDDERVPLHMICAAIWPLALVFVALGLVIFALFGIGYLIGRPFRPKPFTEVPND